VLVLAFACTHSSSPAAPEVGHDERGEAASGADLADLAPGQPDIARIPEARTETSPDPLAQPDFFQGLLDFSFPEDLADSASLPELPGPEAPVNPICTPNHDFVVEASEIPAQEAMGLVACFTVNKPGTQVSIPDLAGQYDSGSLAYHWDFSATGGPDDTLQYESLLPVASFWFQDQFPDGDFVQPFSSEYFGIYRKTETGLLLLGIASVEEGKTALKYGKPVTMIPFPLKKGMSWNDDKTPAEGTFEGDSYPADYGLAGKVSVTHTYQSVADKQGSIDVPLGTFQVIRIATDVSMEVWNSMMAVPAAQRRLKIVIFVAECAGKVALVRSLDGETDKEFEVASELKRLGK
jgi:hypothetical protein